MERNAGVSEGFRPNLKYKRVNTYKGPKFQWRDCPEGRGALIIIGLIATSLAGPSVELTRDFAAQGVGKGPLYTAFVARVPEFPDFYLRVRGVPLAPNIVWDRLHKMLYDNKAPQTKRGQRSKEHFLNSEGVLRKYLPAVEKLWRRKGVITLAELREACKDGFV